MTWKLVTSQWQISFHARDKLRACMRLGSLAKVTLLREKINNTKPGITQHKLISSFQVEEVLIGNEQC